MGCDAARYGGRQPEGLAVKFERDNQLDFWVKSLLDLQ